MSKQTTVSSQLKHMTDDFMTESNPLIEWLSAHKRQILFGFLALFTLIVLSYRVIAARTLKAENDFFQAQIDFTRFQEKGIQPDESERGLELFSQLETILKRHPELHAKYDGQLVQTLIIGQDIEKAHSFAQSIFQRTEQAHLDFYQQYAETSLLINEGKYQEAVLRTQQLQEKLNHQQINVSFGETLYLFNLIRLAMLYQQLNQPEEEWQAWETLQSYTISGEALRSFYHLFNEGQLSLQRYIDERKRVLNL